MRSAAAEVLVVDWDGPATELTPRLGRLSALGIDVVLVPSPATAAAAAGARLAADGPGRLVHWSAGDGDAVGWARHRLLGPGAPADAVAVASDVAALDVQIAAAAGFPGPVVDATWRVDVDGVDPDRELQVESWLTVGNGLTGTRGSLEEGSPTSLPALYVAGVFGQDPAGQAGPELVRGVEWTRLDRNAPAATDTPATVHRTLDLREGVLFREGDGLSTARYASLADRHVLVLEAEADGWHAGPLPIPAVGGPVEAVDVTRNCVRLQGRGGAAASFTTSTTDDGGRIRRTVTVERGVEGDGGTADAPPADPEAVRARHRRAWRDRWLDADVVVDGDDEAQQELRFALYHLMAVGDPDSDAASIGARALSGPGYRGHVFWDTEVFVLPFFAWTHPPTARALLAYRYRTLPAARHKAARLGYEGALYAWESTDTGEEVTPDHVDLPDGQRLTILTGLQEHHIAADVAWAVMHYVQVTGDRAFLEQMGAEIVMETARFWASRARGGEDGRYHVCKVIGPDEYHEGVDDDAYTNVLARWNLRAADGLCDELPAVAERLGVTAGDRARWLAVADGMVDNFDPASLLYEQFDGFYGLEPIRAVDVAPRPFTGEVVLGVERLRASQVVKQADVILLGVLLPEQVRADVQAANYRHYEPLTSHGSSLSPAIHALVAARVGALDDAARYFSLAGGVDLHNRMGNAADGVHIATMGGLWQAAVFGFGGVRPEGDAVRIDPRVPPSWTRLAFTVQWRGTRITVAVTGGSVDLELDGAVTVALGGGEPERLEAGHHVGARDGAGWSWTAPA